jgi:DNA-binding transcriptional LysR family regulator
MRIDLYSLELFFATVREGSIARAAKTEHIAPSALSRRLADLEIAMGAPLLVRSPMGVELTEAGRHALRHASRLTEQLQSLGRDVQSLSGQVSGIVRLFANASAIVGYLPEKLKAFQSAHPLVELALQERTSDEVLRACLDDRADVGVGVALPSVPNGVESWHFADDPLMVVLPPGHALCKRRSLRFTEVLRYPLVAAQGGGSLDQFLRERADAALTPMRVSVAVNSFDALCRMVEAGLGLGIVPSSAASAFAGTRHFVRRRLEEPWRDRTLRVYALRQSPRLRAVQALLETLLPPPPPPPSPAG